MAAESCPRVGSAAACRRCPASADTSCAARPPVPSRRRRARGLRLGGPAAFQPMGRRHPPARCRRWSLGPRWCRGRPPPGRAIGRSWSPPSGRSSRQGQCRSKWRTTTICICVSIRGKEKRTVVGGHTSVHFQFMPTLIKPDSMGASLPVSDRDQPYQARYFGRSWANH